jgi:hypothetical protein
MVNNTDVWIEVDKNTKPKVAQRIWGAEKEIYQVALPRRPGNRTFASKQ